MPANTGSVCALSSEAEYCTRHFLFILKKCCNWLLYKLYITCQKCIRQCMSMLQR